MNSDRSKRSRSASAPSQRAGASSPRQPPTRSPAVDDVLEVEVEEGGGTEWRLGQVAEVARGGRFTVCLVGDGEDESTFRETYSMADHGKEWRWPERSKRQRQAPPQQPTRQAGGSSSDEASGEGGEADEDELAEEDDGAEGAEGEESGRRAERAGRAGRGGGGGGGGRAHRTPRTAAHPSPRRRSGKARCSGS